MSIDPLESQTLWRRDTEESYDRLEGAQTTTTRGAEKSINALRIRGKEAGGIGQVGRSERLVGRLRYAEKTRGSVFIK